MREEIDHINDSPELREKIFNLFPLFRQAGQDVTSELFEHAKLAELPAGQFICHEGSRCSCIPLVLEGCARVYKLSEAGREITLYRVEPGQSCIMTASCILSGAEFPAFAATETEVEAIVIPPETLKRWINQYEVRRRGQPSESATIEGTMIMGTQRTVAAENGT